MRRTYRTKKRKYIYSENYFYDSMNKISKWSIDNSTLKVIKTDYGLHLYTKYISTLETLDDINKTSLIDIPEPDKTQFQNHKDWENLYKTLIDAVLYYCQTGIIKEY